MELRAHLGDLVGRGDELGEHHLDRIAGHQEQHAEDGQGHPEQHGHDGEDSPGEVDQRMAASLRTGYVAKLYFTPRTAARNAHTESSSSSGTVSASSTAICSIDREIARRFAGPNSR